MDVWEITNTWVPSQINNHMMNCGQTSECSKIGQKAWYWGKKTPHNFETRSGQIWKHATIIESMEEQLLTDPISNQHETPKHVCCASTPTKHFSCGINKDTWNACGELGTIVLLSSFKSGDMSINIWPLKLKTEMKDKNSQLLTHIWQQNIAHTQCDWYWLIPE